MVVLISKTKQYRARLVAQYVSCPRVDAQSLPSSFVVGSSLRTAQLDCAAISLAVAPASTHGHPHCAWLLSRCYLE